MNNEITVMQSRLEKLLDQMRELNQPRSDYALEHFVVGQHDTPSVQRKQILDELLSLLFSLGDTNDELELAQIDLQESLETHDKMDDGYDKDRLVIKIRGYRRKIENLNITLEGRLRECETLLKLLDKIPHYSREEFEAEQEDYWSRRLSRQFILRQKGDQGNLDAILQMLTTPGKVKPLATDFPEIVDKMLPEVNFNEQTCRNLPTGNSD